LPNRPRTGPSLPRLYAILDVDFLASRALEPLTLLDIWLAAGVRLVQLRAKTLPSGAFLELAREMARRVAAAGGMAIVNDRPDIARMAGATGVHVGQDDLTPADVRGIVGPEAVVGVSTHTDPQVDQALQWPVDYLAIGPVFPTRTKGPTSDAPVGLDGVRRAVERAAGVPVVAIGGIDLTTAREVLAAGATSVAVVSDLVAGDPAVRARAWQEALDPSKA
jgi:thiamine-phosphate pyrophosphorylase